MIVVVAIIAAIALSSIDEQKNGRVCRDTQGNTGELAQPMPIGSRCVFTNELNYIYSVGEVTE